MKRILIHLFFPMAWIIISCDNIIEPVLPSDPVPIVYCVFNPMDTAYYVSITKSFQGDTDALYLAKQPELLFYDSAYIRLMGLRSDKTILFETGFVPCNNKKDSGIFSESKGYLYKSVKEIDRFFNFDLAGRYADITHFKLEVRIPGYEKLIESTITKIRPALITIPYFDSINYDFYTVDPPSFAIESGAKDYSDCMDFVMRFRYSDYYTDSIMQRELDILFRRNIYHESFAKFNIPPDLLLNQLARHILFDKHVLYRTFTNLDFISFNATSDFQRYLDSWSLTTSDYHMADFSNLTNARGLFSMKNAFYRYNNKLHHKTLDSIALSPVTAKLKFVHY